MLLTNVLTEAAIGRAERERVRSLAVRAIDTYVAANPTTSLSRRLSESRKYVAGQATRSTTAVLATTEFKSPPPTP
jgi:hypothetical protein